MATIKVACPKCGQKVSGDETFHGTVVECPICSASIQFPGKRSEPAATGPIDPVPPQERPKPKPIPAAADQALPKATFEEGALDDIVPQTQNALQGLATEIINSTASEDFEEEEVEAVVPSPVTGAISIRNSVRLELGDVVPSPVTGAISIVTAVLAVVTCPGGILFAPIAIISGHLSQAKARRSLVQPAPGQTLGAIGMLIGYIWLVIAILLLAIAVIFKEPLREPLQEFFGNAAVGE